ncbi:substrate-binding domain-containing protein [Victivallis sp. Marseille-Q1083]|uniref:GntR family transcriptional regulator n=1 Tax=Victivallis sp. Marseille-Q1083 TaxID=2717288 RepID=UPI0015894E1B|nr:substrate-binding domain-containing protein [Victivallis sp. Marseille-Q1083]
MELRDKSLRYMQVYLDLKEKIAQDIYPLHSKIPVEQELIVQYGVSITTLRKAIEMLSRDGLLKKRAGLGTFVVGSVPLEHPQHKPENTDLKVAVVMPDVAKMTLEGDARHWQLNLRRINGIYQASHMFGGNVMVYDLSEDFDLSGFDGAIIFRYYELEVQETFDALVAPLAGNARPYVVISEYDLRFADKYWVVENLELEFLMGYRYLQHNGVKKLLIIGLNLNWENPRLRALQVFRDCFDVELLENPQSDRESAYCRMNGYLDRRGGKLDCDTIFCLTDLQALGVMQALEERNIRIPEDVNLFGCDNIADAASAPVPLTTFQFSGREVGMEAYKLLLGAISGDEEDGLMVVRRGKIIVRDSVMKKS